MPDPWIYKALSQNFRKRLLASSSTNICPSALMSARNNSAHTGWILIKFDIWGFLPKSVEKIQIRWKWGNSKKYFTWTPIHVLTISRSIHPRMWKHVVEKTKTEILFFSKFIPPKIVSCMIYVGKYGTDGEVTDYIISITRRMRFACRITEAIIQMYTHNIWHLMLDTATNGYTKTP